MLTCGELMAIHHPPVLRMDVVWKGRDWRVQSTDWRPTAGLMVSSSETTIQSLLMTHRRTCAS